ncbi:hypothetical protein L1283_005300 [Sphingobacterium sp. HSC-15S19]
MKSQKVWFITGASKGQGLSLEHPQSFSKLFKKNVQQSP